MKFVKISSSEVVCLIVQARACETPRNSNKRPPKTHYFQEWSRKSISFDNSRILPQKADINVPNVDSGLHLNFITYRRPREL